MSVLATYTARGGRIVRCVTAVVLALVAVSVALMLVPGSAWAETKIVGTLEVTCAEDVELERIDITSLEIGATPSSIEVGIPCGMLDMCGQDPCLCGAVDEYGACACNGMETAYPEFEVVSDDEGIVKPVNLMGTWYLVAMGSGTTDVSVVGTLAHYHDGVREVAVHVGAFGAIDFAKALVPVLVAVVLVLLARKLLNARDRSK